MWPQPRFSRKPCFLAAATFSGRRIAPRFRALRRRAAVAHFEHQFAAHEFDPAKQEFDAAHGIVAAVARFQAGVEGLLEAAQVGRPVDDVAPDAAQGDRHRPDQVGAVVVAR